MTTQTKHIEVVPYNPAWPQVFETEAALIKQAVGENCLEVHHIGSTSVPGLAAKRDIDTLLIVDNLEASLALQHANYRFNGEMNIPLRYCFSKNTDASKVNLHVVEHDHGFIALNLCFRDYLRSHEDARVAYGNLKQQILKNPESYERGALRFPGYTLGKDQFIKKILEDAQFEGLSLAFCMHVNEWAVAKAFRQGEFFDKAAIEDPYTWTFDHPDHVHLVLYKGAIIVGYAHLQLWPENRAAMRIIVIDEALRNQGLGGHFLTQCERWLRTKGIKSLHTESSPAAKRFYEKQGYGLMPFNDPDGYKSDPQDTPMGKRVSS